VTGTLWMVNAGRGFGKTRSGVEWVERTSQAWC
jgi:phage terminase large subunit-like protein